MKSELPKVLHPSAAAADRPRPATRRRLRPPRRPWSSATAPTRSGERLAAARASVRRPGAAARNRPRPAAGRAGAGRPDGHGRPAVRRRAAAAGANARTAARRPSRRRRRPRRSLTASRRAPVRLRPHRAHGRPDRAHRRGARRLAGRARDPRDQQRHLRLRPRRRCSTPCEASASQQRPGRVLPDRSRRRSTAGAKLPVETLHGRRRRRDARRQQPPELAEVSAIVRQQKNEELMAAGVTLVDPATTYIDAGRRDRRRTPSSTRTSTSKGATRIGAACEIHAGVADRRLDDRRRRDRSSNYCVIVDSTHRDRRRDRSVRAPAARQRRVGEGAHVGNFVELKKTRSAPGSKANHLAYLGDATIGASVNIGAGTITCNYDGVKKHQTVIEDGAFIGSDSQLVAPVTRRQGRLRRGRFVDHRGRARRRAWHRAAAARRTKTGWVEAQEGGDASSKPREPRRTGSGHGRRSRHVRHHRLHRIETGRARPDRRAAAARIPRLRLRGRRGRARRTASRCGAAPASCPTSRTPSGRAARRRLRHRPHALGHARPAHRGERPPAPRLHRPHRRRPQRHHRELPRAEARAAVGRATSSRPRPTPRSSRTWSSARCDGDGLEDAVRRALRAHARAVRARAAVGRRPGEDRRRAQRPAGRRRPRRRTSSSSPPTSRRSCSHTRDVVFLDDDEMAVLTRDGRDVHRLRRARRVTKPTQRVLWDPVDGGEGRLQALHAQGDLRAAARRRAKRARPRLARTAARSSSTR